METPGSVSLIRLLGYCYITTCGIQPISKTQTIGHKIPLLRKEGGFVMLLRDYAAA